MRALQIHRHAQLRVPAPGGTAAPDGTGANDGTDPTGLNDGTGSAADGTGANDGTGPNDGTGANDATRANDGGTWQWEMYGGERRLCLRCGQTEYLRQGVCFNAQCSLAFQKYTAQELGERLLRWGRVLACKQLLFLLYVIGRMCPQRIHQMEALQNGIMMEELHYMLNASPPTL